MDMKVSLQFSFLSFLLFKVYRTLQTIKLDGWWIVYFFTSFDINLPETVFRQKVGLTLYLKEFSVVWWVITISRDSINFFPSIRILSVHSLVSRFALVCLIN